MTRWVREVRLTITSNQNLARMNAQPHATFTTFIALLVSNAHAAVAPLAITSDVSGNVGRVGERYAWSDSTGAPRSALLVRNSTRGGGLLDRYTYRLSNGNTRTANATASGAGGFGYVVSHLPYASDCAATPNTQFCESIRVIGDDSPLGIGFTGSYRTVFAGRHHAIHEFKTTYPRFTGPHPSGAKFIRYNVPVTIHWMFANGRDHPLWTVTWDWSAVPASVPLPEQIEGDARGPYGELDFDGVAGSGNAIGGVAWAIDQRRFTSTSAPFTLNSTWTWNSTGEAAIPYNMLWIHNANAQMGIVQTSLLATHDAGNGGYGGDFQGRVSPAGNHCADAPGYKLFCVWDWPFQSIENDFYGSSGVLPNQVTSGRRLAWGAKLGAVGRSSYPNYVRATVTQPQAKSYSTFIVLGEHGAGVNPVADQVGELQLVLKASNPITATASVGTLALTGLAGVGRNDTQSFTRAGYNPLYATWDITAANNNAALNWVASGADTLKNPIIRVLGYNATVGAGAGAPASVSFNGAALTADVDYLASVDAASNTLWLTLLRTISGSNNSVAISPPAAVPVACSMDIDGDGHVRATTDALLLARAAVGLGGDAVMGGIGFANNAARKTWPAIREFLAVQCGMTGLAP